MDHVLQAQLTPIISINGYSRKHNLGQSNLQHVPAKRGRTRGVVLSEQGWQKLMQAGALYTELGERRTYEQLSERSQLDERTVSRLLSREVKVDKRTLRTFFRAFNLSLEADDYTLSKGDGTGVITPKAPAHTAPPTTQTIEVERLVEELSQLKQRMREYECLFYRLGLNENYVNQQLGTCQGIISVMSQKWPSVTT